MSDTQATDSAPKLGVVAGSPPSFDLYWPCACVKRDRKGRITALKMHPHNRLKCPKCKGTKAIADSVK